MVLYKSYILQDSMLIPQKSNLYDFEMQYTKQSIY